MLTDISAELDALYGAKGTPERTKFDKEAWNFYTSQINALGLRIDVVRPIV